jgi:hypothetical protein
VPDPDRAIVVGHCQVCAGGVHRNEGRGSRNTEPGKDAAFDERPQFELRVRVPTVLHKNIPAIRGQHDIRRRGPNVY